MLLLLLMVIIIIIIDILKSRLNSEDYCKDHCSGGEIMTRKKKCNSESNSFVEAAEQVCLQPVLFSNTGSDEADVTSLGRLFHTFASAAGKARPPIVDRRQVLGLSIDLAGRDASRGVTWLVCRTPLPRYAKPSRQLCRPALH